MYQGISERVMVARFKQRFINVTVVAVYAPTNSATETQKEEFYIELQDVIDSVP